MLKPIKAHFSLIRNVALSLSILSSVSGSYKFISCHSASTQLMSATCFTQSKKAYSLPLNISHIALRTLKWSSNNKAMLPLYNTVSEACCQQITSISGAPSLAEGVCRASLCQKAGVGKEGRCGCLGVLLWIFGSMWLACLIYFYLVYTRNVSLPRLMSLILFWQYFHAWTQLTCQVTLIGKSLVVSPPEVPLWEKTPSYRGFGSIPQVALRFLRNPSFRCLFKTVQAGWLQCFIPNLTPFCVLCHGALCHGACLSMLYICLRGLVACGLGFLNQLCIDVTRAEAVLLMESWEVRSTWQV